MGIEHPDDIIADIKQALESSEKVKLTATACWKKEMSELSGVSFGGIINNKQNNK